MLSSEEGGRARFLGPLILPLSFDGRGGALGQSRSIQESSLSSDLVESARNRARLTFICKASLAQERSFSVYVHALNFPRGKREKPETYGVHALIAPSGGWIVVLALNHLVTTAIMRLVFAVAATKPLEIGAVGIVRYMARSVIIIDFCVVSVATDTVKEWWWLGGREKKRREPRRCPVGRVGYVRARMRAVF